MKQHVGVDADAVDFGGNIVNVHVSWATALRRGDKVGSSLVVYADQIGAHPGRIQ